LSGKVAELQNVNDNLLVAEEQAKLAGKALQEDWDKDRTAFDEQLKQLQDEFNAQRQVNNPLICLSHWAYFGFSLIELGT
jgi:hypothetical protein